MFVEQHPQAELLERLQPADVFGVVLVVAGDRDHALRGAQLAQGQHVGGARLGRAVNQVACDQRQVRLQGVGAADDGLHPVRLQQAAGVQVGQMNNAKPVECGRQAGQRDFDRLDVWHADRLPDTQRGQPQGGGSQARAQAGAGQQGPPAAAREHRQQQARHVFDE
ncbi:hypothetical protein D3C87_1327830 [compost metagenome]